MKKLKPLFIFILVISIGFGAFCFLYPVISNAINEQFNESKINEYNENTDTLTDAQIQSCFAEAQRYNRALSEDVSERSEAGVLSQYDDILNINDGIMGYLEIPAIDVKLPVYHGETDSVLSKGAGHLEHTSFPIGGESTHACISAHCGYPTQKFFDDLDELENGDEIYICVLNRTLKYTVTDTDVVEPDDSSKLQVIQGEDLLTLVTCTPYGINSHRLLVHAERAPYEKFTSDSGTAVSRTPRNHSDKSKNHFMLAGFAVFIFVIVRIWLWLRKRRRSRQRDGQPEDLQNNEPIECCLLDKTHLM